MTSPHFTRDVCLEVLHTQPISRIDSDFIMDLYIPRAYTYRHTKGDLLPPKRLLVGGTPSSSIWVSSPDRRYDAHPDAPINVLFFHTDSKGKVKQLKTSTPNSQDQILEHTDLYPFSIFSTCGKVHISRPGRLEVTHHPFGLLCTFVRYILEHTTSRANKDVNRGDQQERGHQMSDQEFRNLEGILAVLHGMFEQQNNASLQELDHKSPQELRHDSSQELDKSDGSQILHQREHSKNPDISKTSQKPEISHRARFLDDHFHTIREALSEVSSQAVDASSSDSAAEGNRKSETPHIYLFRLEDIEFRPDRIEARMVKSWEIV
jgi:hypothetical protein